MYTKRQTCDRGDLAYYICLEYVNAGLQDSIDSAGSIKEKIYAWIFHMAYRFCDVPLMVTYIIRFYRQPNLLTKEVRDHYLTTYPTLVSLCKEAISVGLTKTSDPVLMETMLTSPVIRLFDTYEGHENQFDPNAYAECIRLSVDSVLL